MQKIFIICEGVSEEKYIQSLRNLLVKNCADSLIIIENFGGGKPFTALKTNIKNKIKEIKKDGISATDFVYIWLDKDVFIKQSPDKINELQTELDSVRIPVKLKLLFNHMNFEDFFILHYSEAEILSLQNKLNHRKHFITPLIAELYEPIYKTVIDDYSKGKLSDNFMLDLDKLKLCIKNIENQNYDFRSDMKEILELVVQKCEESL